MSAGSWPLRNPAASTGSRKPVGCLPATHLSFPSNDALPRWCCHAAGAAGLRASAQGCRACLVATSQNRRRGRASFQFSGKKEKQILVPPGAEGFLPQIYADGRRFGEMRKAFFTGREVGRHGGRPSRGRDGGRCAVGADFFVFQIDSARKVSPYSPVAARCGWRIRPRRGGRLRGRFPPRVGVRNPFLRESDPGHSR